MSLKDKLKSRVEEGKRLTNQMKAEKIREGMTRSNPVGTVRYGLATKQNPLEFGRNFVERRKMLKSEKKQKLLVCRKCREPIKWKDRIVFMGFCEKCVKEIRESDK